MKKSTRNILIATNIVLLALSVFLFSRLSNTNRVSLDTQISYQDSLSGYKYLAEANAQFFQSNYQEALAAYAQADSLMPGQYQWQQLGSAYVQQTQMRRDSLNRLRRQAQSLQQEALSVADQNEVNQKYIDRLQQRSNLDSVELYNFSVTKQHLSDEVELLTDELEIVKKELRTVKDSYSKLAFIYDANGKHVNYFGQVVDSMASGYGIGVFESKSIYVGDWQNNLRHGTGKYTWANGDIYEGMFKEGKREGQGTYIFLSGEKYEGEWANDVREGKGTFYSPDGKVILDGTWVNDKYQRQPPELQGSAKGSARR